MRAVMETSAPDESDVDSVDAELEVGAPDPYGSPGSKRRAPAHAVGRGRGRGSGKGGRKAA